MSCILYVSDGYCVHDRRFLMRLAESEHEIVHLPCFGDLVQHEPGLLPAHILRLASLSRKRASPGTAQWMRAALRFRRLARLLQPDLIHAGPIQTGGFFAALSGLHPLLVMPWGSDALSAPDQSLMMRWITKFTLRRADIVFADCEAVRQRVCSLADLPEGRVISFPWGIELERFYPKASALDLRRRLNWEQCQIIVSARALEMNHGTILFLNAMKRVLEQDPDARVLLLGDGRLRAHVDAFIQANCLAGRFHMAGHAPEELLPDFFSESDIYVSAAPCDGSSISLLQAMGCGLPVIVADAHGNREWVVHGENGWLYRPGDAEALAATVLQALRNRALRPAMRQANQEVVRSRANWDVNFHKLLAAYDRLLKNCNAHEAETHAQLLDR